MMLQNRPGEAAAVIKNNEEKSRKTTGKTFERWQLNYLETDPAFDFQLHSVKFRAAQDTLKPHRHENSAEIVYMLHGKQYYTVDDRDYCVLGGQLLITPPGSVHSSRQEPEQKGNFYYLTFNPDCLAALLPGDPDAARAIRELFTRETVVRAIPDIEELRALAEELRRAHGNAGVCRRCRVLCAVLRLLLYTLDTVEPDAGLGQYTDFMGFLYLYIEDHITEKLRVDDIAQAAQYSRTALQQKFKTYSHSTVHEYILSRKIEAAKRLMDEPGAKPHEIWKELGFSSQSYFAQVFRRHTGMTISQYLAKRGE